MSYGQDINNGNYQWVDLTDGVDGDDFEDCGCEDNAVDYVFEDCGCDDDAAPEFAQSDMKLDIAHNQIEQLD